METSTWQTKLSSFKERHFYAFNKSLFCDVELSVIDANGDKVTIPAHKYLLAISSPVFEAMFYGELAETGRTVDLPDCTEEGVQEMLRYVYLDEVNLTGSNVLEVLYLADKYMLPFLKKKCEEYLEKELKPEEVFHVLPQIRNAKVEQKCWDMVDSDTERAVSSESFLNISKELLCKVLGRDTLSIDEGILFQAVEKWLGNKLKDKGLEGSMENKRGVLGEDVIKLIRFPVMSQKKFAEKVLPSGILTLDEVTELIRYFNELAPLSGSFSNVRRGNYEVLPNTRFKSIVAPSIGLKHMAYFDRSDAIDFKINKPLLFAGVRLFGNKNGTYDVTLALYKESQLKAAVKRHKEIQQTFNPVQTEDELTFRYYGFDIYFDEPVSLDPDVVYTIDATMNGPPSYYGHLGQSTIAFKDIVITYLDSKRPSYGTTSELGQFPTLLLKRH